MLSRYGHEDSQVPASHTAVHDLDDVTIHPALQAWLQVFGPHLRLSDVIAGLRKALTLDFRLQTLVCRKCSFLYSETKPSRSHLCARCGHNMVTSTPTVLNPLAGFGPSLSGHKLFLARLPGSTPSTQVTHNLPDVKESSAVPAAAPLLLGQSAAIAVEPAFLDKVADELRKPTAEVKHMIALAESNNEQFHFASIHSLRLLYRTDPKTQV